jgi:anion-transporting  ArsA/GET3 family ATPase
MRGELWAAMVGGKATFDEIVRKTAADEETASRILDNRIYRYISASMPGVQEYMATERLYAAKQSPRFDLIVLDTPPTSNALDFLDAPRRMTAAMNSPAVEWLMMMHRGGVLSQGTAFIMRNLSKIAGSNVLERMAELALDFESMLDGMRLRAEIVAETLRSDEVAYILVTSPDPLAVDEAIFLNHRLVEMGLSGGALVVNRMRPHRPAVSGITKERILTELMAKSADNPTASNLAAKLARATREEQSLAEADLVQVQRLRRSCESCGTLCLVPGLDRDVYSLTQLSRLHQWLF